MTVFKGIDGYLQSVTFWFCCSPLLCKNSRTPSGFMLKYCVATTMNKLELKLSFIMFSGGVEFFDDAFPCYLNT